MDDDFTGLEKICPYCNETGNIVNPRFIEWQLNGSVGEHPEIIIRCPMCNGSCLIPTSFGVGILELVRIYDKEDN
jgi:hypothetical protein